MIKLIFTTILAACLLQACVNQKNITDSSEQIIETGDEITKIIDLESFNKIDLAGTDDIYIKEGPIQEISVIGHENIINRLNTKIENDEWKVKLSKGNYKKCHLKISITTPSLNQIKLTGVGNIHFEKFDNLNDFSMILDGVGDINCTDLEAINNLNVKLNGVGNINFNNCKSINILDLVLNGVGDFNASSTETTKAKIVLNGNGDCKLTATNILDVQLSGVGDIIYKGSPQLTQKITGSGKIIKR